MNRESPTLASRLYPVFFDGKSRKKGAEQGGRNRDAVSAGSLFSDSSTSEL